MDISRKKSGTRKRRLRTTLYAVVGVAAISLITFGVSRLKPAAPGVQQAKLQSDTDEALAKDGLNAVRCPLALVPLRKI